jgi:glycosyltransferase involved in cell wall biosynthesis
MINAALGPIVRAARNAGFDAFDATKDMEAVPRVSIGLPVYNGEVYLEDAIRSALAQSFSDLELVICDNASTDRTEEIARDLAAGDRRIRYLRNSRNLGASGNFGLAFYESRGELFKWLAHDDRLEPAYLAATVAALDDAPEVVLCNTTVDCIDERGEVLARYTSVLGDAGGARPAERFATMVLRSHTCVDMFGLVRRSALVGSLLISGFHGADRALLAQLALRGRLLQLPEPLLQVREHGKRYTRQKADPALRRLWHSSEKAASKTLPTLRLYREYLRLVRTEQLSPGDRRACHRVLARWWFANWNSLRVATDLISVAAPGVVDRAERIKTRIFGAAPGHFVN